MKVRRSPLPAPEEFTVADRLRIALSAVMALLGVTILVRTLSGAASALGVLAGGAFIAFGVYRLWLGWSRYRLYHQMKGESRR